MAKLSANGTEVARITTPASIEWDEDGRHWATWSEYSVRDTGKVLVNYKNKSFGPGCSDWMVGIKSSGWKHFHDSTVRSAGGLVVVATNLAKRFHAAVEIGKAFASVAA